MLRRLTFAALALALLGALAAPAAADPSHDRPGVPRGGCRTATGPVTVDVTSQGRTYQVLADVPATVGRARRPLVFSLHGSTSTGAVQRANGLAAAGAEDGVIVAYPNGGVATSDLSLPFALPSGYFWNIPGTPLILNVPAPAGARDDVRFISDAIDAFVGQLCVDPRQVYVTGASGGGRMASLLGCELADRVAAIAPVIGVRAGNPDPADPTRPDPATCRPSRPVPVVAFMGQADPVNPYAGGGPSYWQYSVPTAMARWAELDRCRPTPRVDRLTPTVTVTSYRACRANADVVLYTSSIAGHTWPGIPDPTGGLYGPSDLSLPANQLMLQFFAAHRLKG